MNINWDAKRYWIMLKTVQEFTFFITLTNMDHHLSTSRWASWKFKISVLKEKMLYIEHFGLGENRQQRQNDMGNFLSWPDALAMQFKTIWLNGLQLRDESAKINCCGVFVNQKIFDNLNQEFAFFDFSNWEKIVNKGRMTRAIFSRGQMR